ncbi:MAG: RNA 2',3'-cyclic phosphodiesterase [Blastocatellia bacterium]
MARIFIGIDLPPAERSELRRVQEELRHLAVWGRGAVGWVAAETFHLTVRFLGEVEASQLERIEAECRMAVEGLGPFRLSLGRLGLLPSQRRPRAIVVGVGGDLAALTRLWQQIEGATHWLGGQSEGRGFHPHVTLGRFRRNAPPPERIHLLEGIEGVSVAPLEFVASAIEIKESFLLPQGARHVRRASIPLRRRENLWS